MKCNDTYEKKPANLTTDRLIYAQKNDCEICWYFISTYRWLIYLVWQNVVIG